MRESGGLGEILKNYKKYREAKKKIVKNTKIGWNYQKI